MTRQLEIILDLIASAIGELFYRLVCWVLGQDPIDWFDAEEHVDA